VRRLPSNEGVKEGFPLWNCCFTAINSSIVRLVADRHRLGAYHNKHCYQPFRGCQHRWPWATQNRKIRGFGEFSRFEAATHISTVNCSEIARDRRKQPAYGMFSINLDFSSVSFNASGSWSFSYDGIKFGYPFQNVRLLLLSTNLAWERLQIDTDLLLTSTADELPWCTTSVTLNDLEIQK